MPYIPTKKPIKKKPTRTPKKRKAAQYNPRGPSADIAALIKTIQDEGIAYRKEEEREDKRKTAREWITIGLIFCTLVAIAMQVREMRLVYKPISDQAKAAVDQAKSSENSLVTAERAWVGPQNASFASDPAKGKPLDITISYQNTGREPAFGFNSLINARIISIEDDQKGVSAKITSEGMATCKSYKYWSGGSVVYPTTGFSTYNDSAKEDATFVTNDVLNGSALVVVQGCFVYRTFDKPHHSYFCYFYRKGQTKIQNLGICPIGHDAD